ncbi:MAG: GNAT family N-acetyltransferase [Cyanobacteria bacterium P01_A01_bin.135]
MDSGLEAFVAQFLARDHRIWWAISASPEPVGCLWLGYTVDPVTGDRHPYVFLLHVLPAHRRQGIGRSLMQIAEAWATQQGYRKLSLHVFDKSAEARQLYQGLGYQSQSILMAKNL